MEGRHAKRNPAGCKSQKGIHVQDKPKAGKPADLEGVSLQDAQIRNANMQEARLIDVNIKNTIIENTDLTDAIIIMTNIEDAFTSTDQRTIAIANQQAPQYDTVWDFEGDELGFYENWCNYYNGDWDNLQCGFVDHQDYKDAKDVLKKVTNPVIEGSPALTFCKIMNVPHCDDEPVSFAAKYDPRTHVMLHQGHIENTGKPVSIRIIDGDISYGFGIEPTEWIQWE